MSDQIEDRRIKLDKLRELGVDPYGERFADRTLHAEIRQFGESRNPEPATTLDGDDSRFRAAGRVVLYRDIGSLIFMTVRDWSGDLQYALSKKGVKDGWKAAKLIDLGDHVGVAGQLGTTKTGELTLWVDELRVLGKALRPPPEKRTGLTDVEQRYRKRYVDLASNPESRDLFVTRAKLLEFTRRALHDRGFIEVETPILQPQYGGAAARPFTTHHNTLDMDLFLRISPELYLKRCIVGGLERVFEIGRNFRNEGISPRHNPEFTMLEVYQAFADYNDMMDLTEAIYAGAAREVIGAKQIPFGEHTIDYTTPWPRRKYADLYAEHVGIPIGDIAAARARANQLGYEEAKLDDAVVINTLFEHYVESHLINPTFVIDYPAPLCPLTKRDPNDADVALRFEAYVAGFEICNAYSELNDPAVQAETFSAQLRGEEDETMAVMDEDFVEALECGMPPTGGLGIGIDRMIMLLTGRQSIRDVLLFPLQRPQAKSGGEAEDSDATAESPATDEG